MAKQNNKNLIMWGIVLVISIIIIGPKLGLFSINGLNSNCNSTEPFFIDDIKPYFENWTNSSASYIYNVTAIEVPNSAYAIQLSGSCFFYIQGKLNDSSVTVENRDGRDLYNVKNYSENMGLDYMFCNSQDNLLIGLKTIYLNNYWNNFISCNTCVPNWTTGNWSTCSNGNQTRTVNDTNSCGVLTNKPVSVQSCTITCTPNWTTSAWETCVNGNQIRTVSDSNNCGVTTNKPATSQTCVVKSSGFLGLSMTIWIWIIGIGGALGFIIYSRRKK